MADYKRLVSYIYNYEAGIRKRNVGFSRVESRDGKCKVTIHITASLSPLESLKVYFLHHDGRRMEGIRLGNMAMKNGTGDFRIETNTSSLMNTGYTLDDISGVLVMLNQNKYFGSQWDDREIVMEDFQEYTNKIVHEKPERLIPDIQVQPQNVEDMVMEEELASQIRQPEQKEMASQIGQPEQEVQAAELGDTINLEETIKTFAGTVDYLLGNKQEAEDALPEEEVSATEVEEENSLTEEVQSVESSMEQEESAETQAMEFVEEEQYSENIEEVSEEEEQVQASDINGSCCCEDDYPECVRSILKGFPSVKPFPKSEAKNWVRIEPKDIGMLPVETWILANNSFLLHGYYNYRHLIFGILKLDKGEQFVIGVPGVLQSTEQTMAGMFGFHRFLAADESENQYGSFGYWIQQVIL